MGGPSTAHRPMITPTATKIVGGPATVTPTASTTVGGMSLTGPGFNCSCNNKTALCQTECDLMNSLY